MRRRTGPSSRFRPATSDRTRIGWLLTGAAACVVGTALAQSPVPSPVDVEIGFLEARLQRDEADPITPTRLGHAYLRKARTTGDFAPYARAEAVFQLALKRSPEHFGALTGLAAALSARHAFGEALAVAERAIKAAPDSVDGYAAAGDAALEAGLLEKAAAFYAEVARRAPGYHTETRLANLAAARGEPSKAYEALSRAVADGTAHGLSADLIAWCHVRAGAVAWEHGDWPRAERAYTAALELTPASEAAIEHLAELRAAQGRSKESLELYARAIAINPRPEFHEAVGRVHQQMGMRAEAGAAFARAREGYLEAASGGDPGSYRLLALFLTDVEPRFDEAVEWARKDLAIRQDGVTLGVLAWALLKKGDVAAAAETANRAVAARPVDADTWYRAGVAAMAAKDSRAARARLSRALEINPRFSAAADARERLTLKR